MNLMQLLEFLNSDLAEWERQRRLRKMMGPNEQYLDHSKLISPNGWSHQLPYITNHNKNATPQEFGVLGPLAPTAPIYRPRPRPEI